MKKLMILTLSTMLLFLFSSISFAIPNSHRYDPYDVTFYAPNYDSFIPVDATTNEAYTLLTEFESESSHDETMKTNIENADHSSAEFGAIPNISASFGDYITDDEAPDDHNNFNPVPEPATVLLFGIGLLSLAGLNRRKTQA